MATADQDSRGRPHHDCRDRVQVGGLPGSQRLGRVWATFTDPVEIAAASVDWDGEAPPRMLTRDQWVATVCGALAHYSSFSNI